MMRMRREKVDKYYLSSEAKFPDSGPTIFSRPGRTRVPS